MTIPSQSRQLPVVVEPLEGEALPSYLTRTAAARFCTRADLGWTSSSDIHRHQVTADLELIAARVGTPVQVLDSLTVLAIGPAVTGRTIPHARRTMWRVPAQLRHCPSCPLGHRLAVWDLALTLTCATHHRLLVPTDWTTDLPAVGVGDRLRDHDHETAHAIAGTDDPAVRARLRLTHRMARLIALTADAHWPPTSSSFLEAARTEADWTPAATKWTRSTTPRHPVVLAILVTSAWQATKNRSATQQLAAQAWQRIDAADIDLTRRTVKSLPPRPRPRSGRQPRRAPDASARAVRSRLLRLGLQPHHIPFLLHDSDALLPRVYALSRAHGLARLVLAVLDPHEIIELPPRSRLRVGPSSNTDPEQEWRLSGEVDPDVLDELTSLLEHLAITRQDYRQRRHLLGTLRTVPVAQLPGTGRRWPQGAEELAAGWIWAHMTRGPLVRALHGYRNVDLGDFDRALNPEQRLTLHEHGEHLLTQNLDLVELTHPTHADVRPRQAQGAG